MSAPSLDDAVAACKRVDAKMPPHLAAWLVGRELEEMTFNQSVLGQALYELLGGPGPPELSAIITRMVHPELERRWPPDGRELREALNAYVIGTGRPAGAVEVRQFLAGVQGLPRPRDSGEWLTDRKALDASGRVIDQKPAPRASPSRFGPPKEMTDEELQLARPPRRPATEWSAPAPYRPDAGKKRGAGLIAVLVLIVLAGGTAAAFMLFPTLQRKLPFDLPAMSARSLLITSSPGGAAVLIEGQSVGVTPYAADNRWKGRPKVELRLEGYETFRDTFEGGKEQSLAATLRKKKP